jgi:hypothetical protein
VSAAGCPAAEVSAWPAEAVLRIVRGDPFAFRIVLRSAGGDPVDVSAWQFTGTVASDRARLDFEWQADEGGVNLWLRGDDTERLSTLRAGRFDVSAMQPAAGEGTVILAGLAKVKARVGAPMRNDPDVVPGREQEAIPA